MKLTSLFISSALLFSVAFARPSRFAQRVAAREARRSRPNIPSTNGAARTSNISNVEFSENWSGAVITSPPAGQTFTTVVGTFTVPTPASGTTGGASAWVGIDGDTAQQSILQSGVDFTVSGGRSTFDAWFEWFPLDSTDFEGFEVSPGNVITVSVHATSTTTGTVVLENVSTGKSVTENVEAPDSAAALKGQNAEWIVEDFEEGDSLVPFANFGTVVFSGATASTASETLTPVGATVFEIEQGSDILTSVSISSSGEITVTHT